MLAELIKIKKQICPLSLPCFLGVHNEEGLITMRNKILYLLEVSYLFLVSILVLLYIFPISSHNRAILLAITYCFITLIHINASRGLEGGNGVIFG